MVQPLKFLSELNRSTIFRLKKSLYGLKQAPSAWSAKITQRLCWIGFAKSKSDSSLFIWQGRNGPVTILVYDDNLPIIDTDSEEIGHVKPQPYIYLTIIRLDLNYSVNLISHCYIGQSFQYRSVLASNLARC